MAIPHSTLLGIHLSELLKDTPTILIGSLSTLHGMFSGEDGRKINIKIFFLCQMPTAKDARTGDMAIDHLALHRRPHRSVSKRLATLPIKMH